jgi:hypothetical protein
MPAATSGGNTWTITSGGQVALNDVADTTTRNVTELAYVNKAVWQEHTSGLWRGKISSGAAWAPGAGTGTSPLPAPVTIAAGIATDTVSQNQVSVVATAGTHMLLLKGSGDVVRLSGGANTIIDTGSGNTYILPAAGKTAATSSPETSDDRGHAGPDDGAGRDQLDRDGPRPWRTI